MLCINPFLFIEKIRNNKTEKFYMVPWSLIEDILIRSILTHFRKTAKNLQIHLHKMIQNWLELLEKMSFSPRTGFDTKF